MPSNQTFPNKFGPWALVTGAAAGMGETFARQLVERGLSVLLLDRDRVGLARVAADLDDRTEAVELDLVHPDFMDRLAPALEGKEIGLLVHSAAATPISSFLKTPLEPKLDTVAVNCRASIALCHHLCPAMAERGRGGVILLSSLSAFQGTAKVAAYAATKAYNLSLAESLWAELGPAGVDVLALAPGVTDTPGYRSSKAAQDTLAARTVMDVEPVVAGALDALGKGPLYVPGRMNRLTRFVFSRLLPRATAARVLRGNMEKLYPGR